MPRLLNSVYVLCVDDIFLGAGVREFRKKTDGLQVLLSQAILLGHSDLVEEAVQMSNSFFTQFKKGDRDFLVGMKGIHLISHYKGVRM